jgi:hypothetical protein
MILKIDSISTQIRTPSVLMRQTAHFIVKAKTNKTILEHKSAMAIFWKFGGVHSKSNGFEMKNRSALRQFPNIYATHNYSQLCGFSVGSRQKGSANYGL